MSTPYPRRVEFHGGRIGIHTNVPALVVNPGEDEDFEAVLGAYIAQHLTSPDSVEIHLKSHPDALIQTAELVDEHTGAKSLVATYRVTAERNHNEAESVEAR